MNLTLNQSAGRPALIAFVCFLMGVILCSFFRSCTGSHTDCPEPGTILSIKYDTIWPLAPKGSAFHTKPHLAYTKKAVQLQVQITLPDTAAMHSSCTDTNIYTNTICGNDYSIDITDTVSANQLIGRYTRFFDNRPTLLKTVQLSPKPIKERFKVYAGAMLCAGRGLPHTVGAGPSVLFAYKTGGLAYTWDGVNNSHGLTGYYLISFRKNK